MSTQQYTRTVISELIKKVAAVELKAHATQNDVICQLCFHTLGEHGHIGYFCPEIWPDPPRRRYFVALRCNYEFSCHPECEGKECGLAAVTSLLPDGDQVRCRVHANKGGRCS